MSIYTLAVISLVAFIICLVVLACSYTDDQVQIIESEEYVEGGGLLEETYSPFQKKVETVGGIVFLFTVVHVTIAVAFLVKDLL